MSKKHWQWIIAYVAGGLTMGSLVGLVRGRGRR